MNWQDYCNSMMQTSSLVITKKIHWWAVKNNKYEYIFQQKLFGWACARRSATIRREERVWRLHSYCNVISHNPCGHGDEVIQQSRFAHSSICDHANYINRYGISISRPLLEFLVIKPAICDPGSMMRGIVLFENWIYILMTKYING